MEDLTKQQIVLLVLFVSFVTSIATGIVTVTLLEQAPPAVTQTINRVVERTIETIVPTDTGKTTIIEREVVIREDPSLLSDAIDKNIESVVLLKFIRGDGEESSLGVGVIVSESGLVVTDARNIINTPQSLFTIHNGQKFKLSVVSESAGLALMEMSISETSTIETDEEGEDIETLPVIQIFSATLTGTLPRRGDTVALLGGESGTEVFKGIISDVIKKTYEGDDGETISEVSFKTNIETGRNSSGGPILLLSGDIAGIGIVIDGKTSIISASEIKNLITEATTVEDKDSDNEVTINIDETHDPVSVIVDNNKEEAT